MVALAVDARWVAGCSVVSLGGWVASFSRVVKPGSTSAKNTPFPSSGPFPAGRMEVEAAMPTVFVVSAAVGTTVRSPVSFQVEV